MALVAAVSSATVSMAWAAAVSTAPTWVSARQPAGAVVALAYEPPSGRLAAADRGVVWVGPARGRLAPVHRARGVRDLAFGRDGSLWIAGDEGLQQWRDGRSRDVLPPGSHAVSRIRGAGALWLAAATDGVHELRPDGSWERMDLPLPAGPATALALARSADRVKLGVVIRGVAHWLEVRDGAPPSERRRVGAPGDGGRSAVDVWLAPDAGEAWTLLRDGCLIGPERACAALPPGAEAKRLFRVASRWWLTTGRGLLVADSPAGPWRREAPPLGSLEAHAIIGSRGQLFVGTERGLHVAGAPVGPAAQALAAVADLPAALLHERRDPSLAEVRRTALSYLELGPARLRRLRLGAERRGWFPTLAVRLDHDRGVGRSDDFDQAFISGGLRSLVDRETDRDRSFEASLTLEWDLGDVLHHPESVDVSKEVRELLELRDDVLDEIHHLYFERRRVLLELLALPADQPLEAARLRLRADELAAGIDGWTGGWFGRHSLQLTP